VSRRDIPLSRPGSDSRGGERFDAARMSESGLIVARAIGCFATVDAARLAAAKHALSERVPAVGTRLSVHGGGDNRLIDLPDPVGSGVAATERIPATVHAAPDGRGRVARHRAGRGKGVGVVAGVVAASAGVTAGLVWGLHLGSPSPHSVEVAPVDGSRATPRIDGFAPLTAPGADPVGYRDATAGPDPATPSEGDLRDSAGAAREDPNADAARGAEQDPSALSDPSESVGGPGANGGVRSGTPSDGLDAGAPKVGAGLDRSDGGVSSTGSEPRGHSPSGTDPSYSYSPDAGSGYSRDPDRSRRTLPRVDQDAVPGLGGL
jgi:hypothetical protein